MPRCIDHSVGSTGSRWMQVSLIKAVFSAARHIRKLETEAELNSQDIEETNTLCPETVSRAMSTEGLAA